MQSLSEADLFRASLFPIECMRMMSISRVYIYIYTRNFPPYIYTYPVAIAFQGGDILITTAAADEGREAVRWA